MTITCQCGHTAAFDLFTVDESGRDLPHSEYRCPACHFAWRVQPTGPATITPAAHGLWTVRVDACPGAHCCTRVRTFVP